MLSSKAVNLLPAFKARFFALKVLSAEPLMNMIRAQENAVSECANHLFAKPIQVASLQFAVNKFEAGTCEYEGCGSKSGGNGSSNNCRQDVSPSTCSACTNWGCNGSCKY